MVSLIPNQPLSIPLCIFNKGLQLSAVIAIAATATAAQTRRKEARFSLIKSVVWLFPVLLYCPAAL